MKSIKSKLIIISIVVIIFLAIILTFVMNIHSRLQSKENLFSAIENNDMPTIERILEEYPSLINEKQYFSDILSILSECSNPTPLLEAIRFNNIDLIKYLVENGADVNISKGTKVAYPIIEILNRGFGEVCDIRYELAWLLIEHGADLNVKQQYGTVPYAIVGVKISDHNTNLQQQSLELMKYVIEQGVSLEAPNPSEIQSSDSERHTYYQINEIIGIAARNNYVLIVQYLLDNQIYGIDDSVSLDGTTALIQAVKGEAYSTCKLLIEYGVDKSKVDSNGKTAYDYAIEVGNQEIIALLK